MSHKPNPEASSVASQRAASEHTPRIILPSTPQADQTAHPASAGSAGVDRDPPSGLRCPAAGTIPGVPSLEALRLAAPEVADL